MVLDTPCRSALRRLAAVLFYGVLAVVGAGCARGPQDADLVDNSTFSQSMTADAGLLLMLVPNNERLHNPRVTAWVDAASEEGVRLQPVTDRQFRALGSKALGFAGLVLPDLLHQEADRLLIEAVRTYTAEGGRTMLVFDFGSLERATFDRIFHSQPMSRLSDLAGVDYLFYDELRDKTTGTGHIVALRETLHDLLVPPGKSTHYSGVITTPGAALKANPERVPANDWHAYSGYGSGYLTYASYVTRGEFRGKVLARSTQFGVAAGVSQFGDGTVLFVNLPLTHLKLQTDALPLHGFLRYFIEQVIGMARLSPMPDGIAGMTLNWHLDSMAAQTPSLELEKLGVFNEGPFSIDITAGPDTIEFEDQLGWDLNNNPVAQGLLQRLDRQGHSLGSHGGWIHDHYGANATEQNANEFLPFLELNKAALEKVIGRTQRSYSAPQGNNPIWAMDWLEQQGVVSAYMAGHTGVGPTRHYRDGKLHNPKMWTFPVTPWGRYAVFDEFAYFKIPQKQISAWYRELIDFTIEKNTSRLIYMHPPWAYEWKNVVLELLAYAKSQGSHRFRWYTAERLADFMTSRRDVGWSELRDAHGTRFAAQHPVSLKEMAWVLPKSRYPIRPEVTSGGATVSDHANHWLINAGKESTLEFFARSQ